MNEGYGARNNELAGSEPENIEGAEARRAGIIAQLRGLSVEALSIVAQDTDAALDRLKAFVQREAALLDELDVVEALISKLRAKD